MGDQRRESVLEFADAALGLATGISPYQTWKASVGLFNVLRPRGAPPLDWVCADWDKKYPAEFGRALEIRFNDGTGTRLPQVLVLDNTALGLPTRDFSVQIHATDPYFNAPGALTARTQPALKHYKQLRRAVLKRWRVKVDDRNSARLSGYDPQSHTLICQRVSYEDYLRTNLALDLAAGPISLRQDLHSAGALEPLDASPLANILGVNLLLFTRSGEIVVQKRSRRVLARPGELGPGASGSIAFSDVLAASGKGVPLTDVPVLREAEEELGRAAADRIGVMAEDGRGFATGEWILLGITRELIRGGKPELFGCAWIDMTAEEIERSWPSAPDSWETDKLIFLPLGPLDHRRVPKDGPVHDLFRTKFLNLWHDLVAQGRVSIPLQTALALWYRYKLNGF